MEVYEHSTAIGTLDARSNPISPGRSTSVHLKTLVPIRAAPGVKRRDPIRPSADAEATDNVAYRALLECLRGLALDHFRVPIN
jgi:hypothetical protein